MYETRTLAFNPSTQPVLCKLTRQLRILRDAKAAQIVHQQSLNAKLKKLMENAGSKFRVRAEAKNFERAVNTDVEFSFEKIIATTLKLALANPAAVEQTAQLDVLVLKGDQHVISQVPGVIGENGWLSCKLPVGVDYDTALLMGKHFAWCQVGAVYRLRDETETDAKLDILHEGELLVLDGMKRQGENIFQLEEGALAYFPASSTHSIAGSVIVQVRPLILRKALSLLEN